MNIPIWNALRRILFVKCKFRNGGSNWQQEPYYFREQNPPFLEITAFLCTKG